MMVLPIYKRPSKRTIRKNKAYPPKAEVKQSAQDEIRGREMWIAQKEHEGHFDFLQNAHFWLKNLREVRFARQTSIVTTKFGLAQVSYNSTADNRVVGKAALDAALNIWDLAPYQERKIDEARRAIRRNLMCWR